jgi:hypothetical protein
MKIPFSNRTVDVGRPNTQGQAKVTFKNIMEDFIAKREIISPSYSRLLSYYRLAKFVLLVAPH